ncbi:hypothetical protein ACN26Y_27040 [Micromonospora sp. WMMD558]|uniref:hypothetical protein n=1 Tax=Micromonospora sp. WMMD558 TaxID=3403462 RepID=UPI003BF46BAB
MTGGSTVPTLRSWDREGPLFVWRTHDGRTYYAVLDGGPTATPEHSSFAGSSEPLGPQTESIRAQVRASVLDSGRPLVGDVQPGSRYLAAVVGLVCLAVLIAGPAPVVGTRWHWFWIGTGVPFGLGVLTWLIIERPGSRRAGASPELATDNRYRGLTGFLIGIAASIALGFLGVLLGSAFDTWLIPEPPG